MGNFPRKTAWFLIAMPLLVGGLQAQSPMPQSLPQSTSLSEALKILDVEDLDFEVAFPSALARNPQWEGSALRELQQRMRDSGDGNRRQALVLIQGFRDEPAIRDWVAKTLVDPKTPVAQQKRLLEMLILMSAPPDPWISSLRRTLTQPDLASDTIAVAKKHGLRYLDKTLQAIASDNKSSPLLRIAAADAIATRQVLPEELVTFLLGKSTTDKDLISRWVAARALGSSRLKDDQLLKLAANLPTLSATTGLMVLPAFTRSRSLEVGQSLVLALEKAPLLKVMTLDDLDRLLASYPDEVLNRSESLRVNIRKRMPENPRRLIDLPAGNAERGKEVFRTSKASCVSCHRAGDAGGGIGPNLSRVGFLRSPQDLLNSIATPGAIILPEFRSFRVSTEAGLNFQGFLIAETADTLWIREGDKRLRQARRPDVEDLSVSSISMMPDGLDRLLSPQELSDLIEYLYSLK